MPLEHITLHGYDVAYRMQGRGPALVLLHGMAGSSATWRHVMPHLARDFTVVAPDLLGHGGSAKPRTDYSVGALGSVVRDLLVTLGVDRATVAGQSCCGDDHVWRPATALTPDAHAPLLQTASLVWAIQPPIAPHIRTPALPSSRRFLARGPPPVPIYLRHLSLQI